MGLTRKNNLKIVVILGPTASGKSDLAISMASRFNGEIVSADSRQVYRKMNIGSGKITKKEMMKIKHYCIDIASPKRKFSVAQYQKIANQSITEIINKNKLPILCGGSAFYIKSVTQGMQFPEVTPNWKLRKDLQKKNVQELYQMLKKIDPERAKTIEKNNSRRLIRAIEIVTQTKQKIPVLKLKPEYENLFIGIKKTQKDLNKKIENRLNKRFKKGMISEVKKLREHNLSWKRLESFGLEYEWIAKYLQKKITKQQMKENLLRDIIKFSKKQMSWWKNDKKIKWIENKKQAEKHIRIFLK